MRSSRFYLLMVAALAAGLPTTLWSESRSDFFGVWTGTVTEVVVAGSHYSNYEVSISLVPGDYSVDYPTLGCGGRLRLLEQRGRQVRFRDELGYGFDACSNGGRTELRLVGPNLGAYLWFDAEGHLRAEGVLKRRRQIVT